MITNVRLTEVGHRQAQALVAQLVALAPTTVVSSPYRRAVQTVEPTANMLGVEVGTDWRLREWDSGLEVCPDWADHYARSWADQTLARPSGESLHELARRAVDVLRRFMSEGGDQVLVVGSHGTFISQALAGFGVPVDWAFWRDMPMPAVYHLSFSGPAAIPVVRGPGLPTEHVQQHPFDGADDTTKLRRRIPTARAVAAPGPSSWTRSSQRPSSQSSSQADEQ
jgi:2,3-bisphosphoglycerate-dependent phosphoglycerate mutase